MSALPQESVYMTETEYLAFERASEMRHEYSNGRVFAMTGASRAHNLISSYTTTALVNALGDRPCEVYAADMRVRVQAMCLYTYPDIAVVCGEPHFADNKFDTLLNPTVIIEVLSPTTERYERGKKFQDYRRLPSLQEYVLISQESPCVERFLRQPNNEWVLTDAEGLEASVELSSIDCVLALADVYRKVSFDANEEMTESSA